MGDWTGCREWLDRLESLLAETRSVTKAVDLAFLGKNFGKIKQAIESYFQAWGRVFDVYHASQR
jgi:hypothetical protein